MPKLPTIQRHLRGLRDALAESLPVTRPVRLVMRSRIADEFGECALDGNVFTITVNLRVREAWSPNGRAVTVNEASDTLVHEWAHALVWDRQPEASEGHDGEWGRAYAKAYRVARRL